MESKPLVSLNILTYNRKDLLKITLLKIKEQDYINIEIIVVDNASTDGTGEMIEKEFPDVIHIKMEKNYGISGWNRGFKRAAGEYIMVLDDDSYPTNGVIENGLREFSNNRDLGAVTFNVFNRAANSSETSEFMIHPYFFHGCGTLFRKSVLDEIGYFNELIFIIFWIKNQKTEPIL